MFLELNPTDYASVFEWRNRAPSHMVSEVGWLVGGSWAALLGGVAERRTGLQFRRQQQEESAAAGSERAWETEDDDEDGSWVGPAAPAASGSASEPGREEFLLAELRDLQTSVPVGGPFPQSDSGGQPDRPAPGWRHCAVRRFHRTRAVRTCELFGAVWTHCQSVEVADYLSRLPHIANLGEGEDNVTERIT